MVSLLQFMLHSGGYVVIISSGLATLPSHFQLFSGRYGV